MIFIQEYISNKCLIFVLSLFALYYKISYKYYFVINYNMNDYLTIFIFTVFYYCIILLNRHRIKKANDCLFEIRNLAKDIDDKSYDEDILVNRMDNIHKKYWSMINKEDICCIDTFNLLNCESKVNSVIQNKNIDIYVYFFVAFLIQFMVYDKV